MFENIFFDLDGTIIDSREGIVNSVIYSLKNFNIEVKNREELEKFIGPPLNESFKEFYNFNENPFEGIFDFSIFQESFIPKKFPTKYPFGLILSIIFFHTFSIC